MDRGLDHALAALGFDNLVGIVGYRWDQELASRSRAMTSRSSAGIDLTHVGTLATNVSRLLGGSFSQRAKRWNAVSHPEREVLDGESPRGVAHELFSCLFAKCLITLQRIAFEKRCKVNFQLLDFISRRGNSFFMNN